MSVDNLLRGLILLSRLSWYNPYLEQNSVGRWSKLALSVSACATTQGHSMCSYSDTDILNLFHAVVYMSMCEWWNSFFFLFCLKTTEPDSFTVSIIREHPILCLTISCSLTCRQGGNVLSIKTAYSTVCLGQSCHWQSAPERWSKCYCFFTAEQRNTISSHFC